MAGILKVDRVQSDSNLAFNIAGSNVAFMNASSLQMVGSNVSLAGTNVITNGRLVTSGMPVGSVLQVVNSINTVESSTTSTSFTASNLSATITPTSTSSKILIICNSPLYAPGDNYHIYTTIFKNGTNVSSAELQLFSTGPATGARWSNGSMTWFDTPSSTSALTYTVYFRSITGGNASYYMTTGQRSIMTLMEIAG